MEQGARIATLRLKVFALSRIAGVRTGMPLSIQHIHVDDFYISDGGGLRDRRLGGESQVIQYNDRQGRFRSNYVPYINLVHV